MFLPNDSDDEKHAIKGSRQTNHIFMEMRLIHWFVYCIYMYMFGSKHFKVHFCI